MKLTTNKVRRSLKLIDHGLCLARGVTDQNITGGISRNDYSSDDILSTASKHHSVKYTNGPNMRTN